LGAAGGGGVEEKLVAIGEGDVDYYRLCVRLRIRSLRQTPSIQASWAVKCGKTREFSSFSISESCSLLESLTKIERREHARLEKLVSMLLPS
jgi:hypothetical protein